MIKENNNAKKIYFFKGTNPILVIIFFVLIFFFAIIYLRMAPLPDRHIKRQVVKEEFIGIWKTNEKSLNNLKYFGYDQHLKINDYQLILNDNGSCTFVGYNDYHMINPSDDKEKNDYMTATGNWEIKYDEKFSTDNGNKEWGLIITFDNDFIRKNDFFGKALWYIYEENAKLILWTYAGDPDSVRYFDLIKK